MTTYPLPPKILSNKNFTTAKITAPIITKNKVFQNPPKITKTKIAIIKIKIKIIFYLLFFIYHFEILIDGDKRTAIKPRQFTTPFKKLNMKQQIKIKVFRKKRGAFFEN